MANVTDPLAAAVHGTDPQNLMEYITRQKIYESRFWKEECFGLTAADVLEKAATSLKCVGASFGGNSQPTKFLSLVLKLLQLQPPPELIENTFVEQEDFKYVRALGAMYQRLTGRPAAIYETLEPLYRDYRKLKYRDITEWKLTTMDQFIHSLLHEDRVCGISLPRLAARETLVEEGYLEEDQYKSPVLQALGEKTLEQYLHQKVLDGSPAAKILWGQREAQWKEKEAEQHRIDAALRLAKEPRSQRDGRQQQPSQNTSYYSGNGRQEETRPSAATHEGRGEGTGMVRRDAQREYPPSQELAASSDAPSTITGDQEGDAIPEAKRPRKEKKRKNKDRSYGNLFKSSTTKPSGTRENDEAGDSSAPAAPAKAEENSEEYWNEQRAKLGLKPLRN
jgi:pre-mRNA-splicing factor 38A